MRNELQKKMIASVSGFRLPRYAEITNVGLYLEQTVRFVNAYLAPLGEPELTTSMVSNYVKQKLIDNPQKKLYNADQIARLLFIAATKPVASLEDARMLFELQERLYPLPMAYDYFCDEFENMLFDAFDISQAVEGLGETQSDAKDLLRNTITAVVNKVYLDQYMAAYRETREKRPEAPEKAD